MQVSPRRSSRLLQLPLSLLLLIALVSAFLVPAANNSIALADEGDDPTQVDEGDLAFLYTGDDMADPERRDFPVQPDTNPDLPFTITDIVAVSTTGGTSGGGEILGYIWYIQNAKIAPYVENTVFHFGSYAITTSPYLDISIKGNEAGEIKVQATMVAFSQNDLGDAVAPRLIAKKGKTKVVIEDNTNPIIPGDLGFVELTANPSIIGVGDQTTFTAQLLTPDREPDTTDGIDLRATSPVNLGPMLSVNGRAIFPTQTINTPGYHVAAASAPNYTPDTGNLLTVIEVVDLIPDRGTPGTPGNTSTSDEIPCWYVPINPAQPTLTINAIPNLPLPDDKLPTSWTLRTGESGQVVPHSSSHADDTRSCITIDATTVGEHLIIAKCGTSERKLCVVIYDPPTVIIEVNNTAEEADDLVQIHSEFPPIRFRTNCRVKVIGATEEMDITLTNPDGQVRFHEPYVAPEPEIEDADAEGDPDEPGTEGDAEAGEDAEAEPEPPDPGEETHDLTLPASGDWVEFSISGESGSDAVDDAIIEVHDRINDDTPPEAAPLATEDMTVFWFEPTSLDITPLHSYSLFGDVIATTESVAAMNPTTVDDVAVSFQASATIKPDGIDTTQPLLEPMRVGFIQSVTSYRQSAVYSDIFPWVPFADDVEIGAQFSIASSIEVVTETDEPSLDSFLDRAPLYDRQDSALAYPLGYPSGGVSLTTDTPRTGFDALSYGHSVPDPDSGELPFAFVLFLERDSVSYRIRFTVWSVVYNIDTDEYVCLQSRDWEIDFAQEGDDGTTAMPTVGELTDVQSSPVDSGPYTTELIQDTNWWNEHTSVTDNDEEIRTFTNTE